MRLEDHVNAFESALPRRSERSSNLCWMMAVIINHADIGCAAFELKTPIYTAKSFQRFTNAFRCNVQPNANSDGRGCVEDIVIAGHLKMKITQQPAVIFHS